jgi:hypothetical protein
MTKVLQQRVENASQEVRMKPEFSTYCALLCDEVLKVVLQCMGTTYGICCRNHTNMAHTSTGIGF